MTLYPPVAPTILTDRDQELFARGALAVTGTVDERKAAFEAVAVLVMKEHAEAPEVGQRLLARVLSPTILPLSAEEEATPGMRMDQGLMSAQSRCHGCENPILFALSPRGKALPLDARAPVYFVHQRDGELFAQRVPQTYVSHFSTCPAARAFSKRNR